MFGSYVNDGILKFNASRFFGLYWFVLFLCLGVVLIGCQHQSRYPVVKEDVTVYEDMTVDEDMMNDENIMIDENKVVTENMMVKQSRQAFLSGDYLLAREKFQALSELAEGSEDQSYGRFGLVCVTLATAGDASAFHRVLVSFLQHYNRNSTQADSAGVGVAPPKDSELLIRALEHGSRLMMAEQQANLNLIDGLKAKTAKQNREIHKLQTLVKTLQHQISTLESIDQDLQEKRKTQ